ncbi:hypothetical protein WJX73_007458 [Symbiochloris irregularis]|uniref:Short-chain dehydrogenase/reductase SDR n=1 Tax=Symbiochloris irregularis TaxID=706552 RepID=A0AAW1PFZ1_9CHLO
MASKGVAVVVGVGPSTGAAAARRFGREGYKVALLARKLESLEPVQKQIKDAGGEALAITCDAGKPTDVQAAFKRVQVELGSPEVLVYNTGPSLKSFPPPGLLETTAEEFNAGLACGVTGALVAAQQVLPGMVKAGRGTIIFTGATAAMRGGKGFTLLSAPSFALRSLGQSIAREFGPQGVHCAHVIIDGLINTPRARARYGDIPQDTALAPDAIAETYWHLHQQHRSAWTQELDLRPFSEKW